jgi:hypothetical protein
MGYAVTFLLFFSISILITGMFMTFGMAPMSNLKAAVTAYAVFVLIKTRSFDTVKNHVKILVFWILFLGYLSLAFLLDWVMIVINPESLVGKAIMAYKMSDVEGYTLIGITLAGVSAGRFPSQTPWIRWLSFAGISLIFSRFVNMNMNSFPSKWSVLIWRYSGIFDLPMLFCVLMAVQTLFRVQADELG